MGLPQLSIPGMTASQAQTWAPAASFSRASLSQASHLNMPRQALDSSALTDWANTTSVGAPMPWASGTGWPTYDDNGQARRKQKSSDTAMPDYVFYSKEDVEQLPDPMHLSGPSLDQQEHSSLKVPTNTPTDANPSSHCSTS
jgi:hypothetical protein